MNYNYTAWCWFPTPSNILIHPSQFWQTGLKVTDFTVQSAEYWCSYGTVRAPGYSTYKNAKNKIGRLLFKILQLDLVQLRTRKHQCISSVLQSLHWLPVQYIYRIMFKILLLSYQCFHNLAPSYLPELLPIYNPVLESLVIQENLFCSTFCPL